MEDVWDPYKLENDIVRENMQGGNVKTKSIRCQNEETPPRITETMKISRLELQSCREDHVILIKSQEKKN